MKQPLAHTFLRRIAALAGALALTLALGACSMPAANATADENAAKNRQFIAQLNQKTGELSDVLAQFQTAVSEGDAVGMKAASDSASKIAGSVKALKAPVPDKEAKTVDSSKELDEVKDAYVEGMNDLNAALVDYASLYSEVAAGDVSQSELTRSLETLQSSYDKAVEKLEAADKQLTELANK